MEQLIRLILLLVMSFCIAIFFKKTTKITSKFIVSGFALGAILVIIGSIVGYIFYNKQVLIDILLLKVYAVGRLVFIGYVTIFTSFLLFISKLINEIRK